MHDRRAMKILSRIPRIVDRLVSPIQAYRNLSLATQNKALLHNIRRGAKPGVSAALLLRNIVQWLYAVALTPVVGLARIAGLRFLMVDLSQIGSVMWIDLYLREMKLNGKRTRAIFVCRSRMFDANAYLLDLYRPYLVFISNPVLKFLCIPFFVNPWLRDDAFRFDAPFVGGAKSESRVSYGYQVCSNYNRKFDRPLIEFSEAELRRGRAETAQFLPPGKRFVAVHVRDSGFYGDTRRTTRNADIRSYEPAFRYLIESGFFIIRLGDPSTVRIDDMIARCGPGLVDYAHSPARSVFLDIYLAASCEFFFGCNSGVLALPIIFNKPACFVNFYNASTCLGYRPGDLSTFKKIRNTVDASLVSFEDMLRPPLSENIQLGELRRLGYDLEDNSPEEILETVREFVETRATRPSQRQKEAKALIPSGRHSFRADGDYSETILRQYFAASDAPPFERRPGKVAAGR